MIITQINYTDIIQINYASRYADYALIITPMNYANQITPFPYIYAYYANTDFHCAELRNGQLADVMILTYIPMVV